MDVSSLVGVILPQVLLVLLIWGPIAYLAANQAPIPDALLDAGFIVLGFYFHAAVNQMQKMFRDRQRM